MSSRGEARGNCQSQVRRRQSPAARPSKDPPDPPEQGGTLGTRASRNGRAKSSTVLNAPPQRRRPDCASIPETVASDDCASKLSTLPVRNTSRSHGNARSSAARPKSPQTAAGPGRQSPTDRAPPAADDDAPCPSVGADAVVGVASGAAGPVVAAGDASPAVSPKAADRVASDASSAGALSGAVLSAASSSTDPSDRSTGQLSMAGDRSMGDLLLGMGDLLFVLGKERPATRLFQCSTAAVKDGMRNSKFLWGSVPRILEDVCVETETQSTGETDQISRNKSEDSNAAAR